LAFQWPPVTLKVAKKPSVILNIVPKADHELEKSSVKAKESRNRNDAAFKPIF
jgi:hypothetical protein